MKLAAIDIGSNSVHMIVAETTGARSFEIIDREKEMVVLGRSVFEHGRITEDAFERALVAIERLHKLAGRHAVTGVRAVATAAVREADNGADLLYAIGKRTGIAPRLISGTEEARYIYLAARSAIDLGERRAMLIDIGGGSVELVVGDGHALGFARSLRLGVQRLRARFGSGPLGKRQRRDLEDHVQKIAEPALAMARRSGATAAFGTSGTILALGHAAHRLAGGCAFTQLTGRSIPLAQLSSLTERLLASEPAERAAIEGIDAKRADAIHLGGALLCQLLERSELDAITLCDASLREGLVIDWLDERAGSDAEEARVLDIRERSVRELARRCGQTGPHPAHVARLSLSLFDQTRRLHRLPDADRKLLEFAALLHDVGQHIGYERHEQHAAYIIKHGDLRGFSDLDRTLIALIARYHRKARPRRHDPELAALTPERRRALRTLSAMLRLADGLDRSHHQVVQVVNLEHDERELSIRIAARGDAELELWGARRKSKLLSRVLRRHVRVELESSAAPELGLRHTA